MKISSDQSFPLVDFFFLKDEIDCKTNQLKKATENSAGFFMQILTWGQGPHAA